MKPKKLLVLGALLGIAIGSQAGEVYWEGDDSWNGNIGSTDYADGQSWSFPPAYTAYGSEPLDGDRGLIANWGQPGTALTQPILSSVITSVPLELRIGGSNGSFGILSVVNGGSLTVHDLNVNIWAHGDGTLNVSGGSITATNGMRLGEGGTHPGNSSGQGRVNQSGGTIHVSSLSVGAVGRIELSDTALFIVDGDRTSQGYVGSYFFASNTSYTVKESYDAGNDWTEFVVSTASAVAPGPVWSEPVTASDAFPNTAYADLLVGKAIDANDDTITYEKIDGADWLTVSGGGILGGTPTESDMGTNTFTVSATDGTEAPVEAELSIFVGDAPVGHIISLNFISTLVAPANQEFDGGQLIGPLATDSANWNSTATVLEPNLAASSMTDLIDDLGSETTADVTWSASGVGQQVDGVGNDEAKLSIGYLDDAVLGLTITVTDIPYAKYTVYGLFSSIEVTNDAAMVSLDFEVNGSWVYGGASPLDADVYGNSIGNVNAHGERWTEIVPGSVTGSYWTVVATDPTLTITGQVQFLGKRGSLCGIIIEEIAPANPVEDLAISSSLATGVELSWTGEADKFYGVETNASLVAPDWKTLETGLLGDGGIITVTNAADPNQTFYRVISE